MAEASAANINTRSGPNHKRCRGPNHSRPEQMAAPGEATSALLRYRPRCLIAAVLAAAASRLGLVIVAPNEGSGRSMPGKAGADAKLGDAQLG